MILKFKLKKARVTNNTKRTQTHYIPERSMRERKKKLSLTTQPKKHRNLIIIIHNIEYEWRASAANKTESKMRIL
jgi:hypothetical protein